MDQFWVSWTKLLESLLERIESQSGHYISHFNASLRLNPRELSQSIWVRKNQPGIEATVKKAKSLIIALSACKESSLSWLNSLNMQSLLRIISSSFVFLQTWNNHSKELSLKDLISYMSDSIVRKTQTKPYLECIKSRTTMISPVTSLKAPRLSKILQANHALERRDLQLRLSLKKSWKSFIRNRLNLWGTQRGNTLNWQ